VIKETDGYRTTDGATSAYRWRSLERFTEELGDVVYKISLAIIFFSLEQN